MLGHSWYFLCNDAEKKLTSLMNCAENILQMHSKYWDRKKIFFAVPIYRVNTVHKGKLNLPSDTWLYKSRKFNLLISEIHYIYYREWIIWVLTTRQEIIISTEQSLFCPYCHCSENIDCMSFICSCISLYMYIVYVYVVFSLYRKSQLAMLWENWKTGRCWN